MPKASNRTRPVRRGAPAVGTLRVKYRELLTSVGNNTTQNYEFLPGATGMPHLDARAGLYEMYKIIGVRFIYKAAVGTTVNGEVLLGVDFDSRDIVPSYQGTAALQPKATGPVWRDFGLRVPPGRAMKQRWLLTSNLQDDAPAQGAFTLQVTNTSTVVPGTIWCEYYLEFVSPRIPTRPVAVTTLNVSSQGGSTGEGKIGTTDALISPSSSGDGFYVMKTPGYDYRLASGFSQTKVADVPSTTGNVWTVGEIYKIIGPSAVKWFIQAASPQPGGYAVATALTLAALKSLAGFR